MISRALSLKYAISYCVNNRQTHAHTHTHSTRVGLHRHNARAARGRKNINRAKFMCHFSRGAGAAVLRAPKCCTQRRTREILMRLVGSVLVGRPGGCLLALCANSPAQRSTPSRHKLWGVGWLVGCVCVFVVHTYRSACQTNICIDKLCQIVFVFCANAARASGLWPEKPHTNKHSLRHSSVQTLGGLKWFLVASSGAHGIITARHVHA